MSVFPRSGLWFGVDGRKVDISHRRESSLVRPLSTFIQLLDVDAINDSREREDCERSGLGCILERYVIFGDRIGAR